MPLPAIDSIIDDLGFLDDWEDRYRYIIELGRMLPPLSDEARIDANKVRGCASQVWLESTIERSPGTEPRLVFNGDSDAHIVRGLVALAIALYSGRPAAEIVKTDAVELFGTLGLKEHLSAQRSNGFRSLIERIRQEAARSLTG
jgi:cysteine desulfuration protein SufE